MIVQANSHLGFVCHDLDKSVQFYEEILGCREKFSLYYGDMIPPTAEERAKIPSEVMARLEELRSVRWIVYLEWIHDHGLRTAAFSGLTLTVLPKTQINGGFNMVNPAFWMR